MKHLIPFAVISLILAYCCEAAVLWSRNRFRQQGRSHGFFGSLAQGLAGAAMGAGAAPMGPGGVPPPMPFGGAQPPLPFGGAQPPMPFGGAPPPVPLGAAHAPMQPGAAQAPVLAAQSTSATPSLVHVADGVETTQKVLEKQLSSELERAQKIQNQVQQLKEAGSLEKPQGLTAMKGTPVASDAIKALTSMGEQAPAGEALASMEAPIIILEPPPLQPDDQLEVNRCAECALEKAGKETAAMKAARQYELSKLGEVNANNLEETEAEIKTTQAEMKKRKDQREELSNKLKLKSRELMKTRKPMYATEAEFANRDLKRVDKEIEILIKKLETLQHKKTSLIGKHPGEEAMDEAEKEEEEGEEE